MTRGSIFAKFVPKLTVTKEQAGLIVRKAVVKGIMGYFGYELGTMMFSKAPEIGRYEQLLQQARKAIEMNEGTLRNLYEGEEKLVQLDKKYNKALMKYYDSRASN
ncbi:hypothetical protein HA466_0139200 [Hirschfeldia incana]|nr:hypothetical protein HA466_0139200 [Hirschfeldia incana]